MSDLLEGIFEIITVGNELLNGKTLNTNAHGIAGRLTSIGGYVRRCITVRDKLEDISSSIREALGRKTEVLIIVGGLGPTYDDMTLQGLGQALNRKLEINEYALKSVKEKYKHIVKQDILEDVQLTPHRIKMATLPMGADPLENPIGTAPGVYLKEGGTSIFCLPGIPEEMYAIFDNSIIPLIKNRLGELFHKEMAIKISNIYESSLAPLIEIVRKENPNVYIKSHPRGVEDGKSKIDIQLTSTSRRLNEVLLNINKVKEDLKVKIEENGGKIDEEIG